jgi:predicted CXXCH cytochrome family protein
MKLFTVLVASLLVIGTSSNILAVETPPNIGPAVIELKMGNMRLPFQHLKHQKLNNNECFHCHKPQEWKIKGWNKEVAHQICISCHDLNEKGPVECKGCHTK